MYWLLACKSKLSTSNTLILYKAILKPTWVYRIQLWGMVSTSNIESLECFQSKALCKIVDTPWFMPNTVIQRKIPTVKDEVGQYSSQYSANLTAHPNNLVVNLMCNLTTVGDCEYTCHMICLSDS
jgi:hypothetical protein